MLKGLIETFFERVRAYIRQTPHKLKHRLGENLALAPVAILARPVRAGLMIVSLGAGVCVVSLSSAIISGFSSEIERLSFGAYARSLVITPNYLAADQSRVSRLTDINQLVEALGPERVDGAASWRIARQVPVAYQAERADLFVYGVLGDYQFEADMDITQGRRFEPSDVDSSRRICLLGAQAAQRLFDGRPAAGRTIRVNGASCHVQGVFAEGDTVISSRFSNAIIAPFHSAARYFMPTDFLAPNEASRQTIILKDAELIYEARLIADRTLRRRHGVPQSQPPPFLFADPGAPTSAMEQQRDLISKLLYSIAAVAMLAAILAFAGASWTLTELRRRSIAVQAIHGASYMDILIQFTAESLMLGTLGGLFGVGLALGLAQFTTPLLGWYAEFDPVLLGGSILLGVISGAIAGSASAQRAAKTLPGMAVYG